MQSVNALQYGYNESVCNGDRHKKFDELLNSLPEQCGYVIVNAFIKAWNLVNDRGFENIACAVSGGSDSDVLIDLITKVDIDKKVRYFFADPGLEYSATREHIDFLEAKYGVRIERFRTEKPVVSIAREKGIPFLSKRVSEMIYRLQLHDFQWEDEPYEVLVDRYPNCVSALMWWTNYYGEKSRLNIDWNRGLKQFLVKKHGPGFKVSAKCCIESKEDTLKKAMKKMGSHCLMISGVRKAEGGYRSIGMKSCTTLRSDGGDFRPIFWFKEEDKKIYCEYYGIEHSFCYTAPENSLRRTGCCCCPMALPANLENERRFAKEYDPMMYKAVENIFAESYGLAEEYREFVKHI